MNEQLAIITKRYPSLTTPVALTSAPQPTSSKGYCSMLWSKRWAWPSCGPCFCCSCSTNRPYTTRRPWGHSPPVGRDTLGGWDTLVGVNWLVGRDILEAQDTLVGSNALAGRDILVDRGTLIDCDILWYTVGRDTPVGRDTSAGRDIPVGHG